MPGRFLNSHAEPAFKYSTGIMSSGLNQRTSEEGNTRELSSLLTMPLPSISSRTDEVQARRVSTEEQRKPPPLTTFTTPHDLVLSDLHGTFLKAGSNDIFDSAPVRENQDAASQGPGKESSSSNALLDPFDGSVLGVLLPQGQGFESENPSQINLANNPLESGMNANPMGSEAVWSQLSRVLDIQGEISKMHLDMEKIGLNRTGTGTESWKGKKSHWKKHQKAPPENLGPSSQLGHEDISGMNWPRERAMSTVSTISSSGEAEGDEAVVNFQDDDEEKSRIRGEEFARLSSQFEGRKEAIHGIMAKASLTINLCLVQTDSTAG